MKVKLEGNFSFVFKLVNNFRITELFCPAIMDVFQYFDGVHNNYISYYDNSLPSSLDKIISHIEMTISDGQNRKLGGGEEAFFDIKKESTLLCLTLPGEFSNYEIETPILYNVLKNYKQWLMKLESCQIPGIIPESKLDTWSCVPNEYIKEEWWDKQKNSNTDESGT
jgi:hypothetical protein